MKILVVGGGGREHALCWAIAASPLCQELYCAPGNAGIAAEAACVPIAADDIDALVGFAADRRLDFVVVGPEAPLALGLADRLEARGIRTFGPTAAAARLESSKGFMKDLCARHGIPTAGYRRFRDPPEAAIWIDRCEAPIVVKADGLAAGKGVTIAATKDEAKKAVEAAMVGRAFGDAGAEVVIEDCLEGEELSFLALVDGETALPLAGSQDHKAAHDGDTGPNTGGMGAYSPAPALTPALEAGIMDRIMRPAVAAMAEEGHALKGVLYAGLMLTADGPQVLEFNVRFGDPECQVLIMRLMSDLLPALVAARDGALDKFDLRWHPDTALTVVMAARGYPGAYTRGSEIRGLDALAHETEVKVFHAGTREAEGRLLADGGRVLNVTALGATVAEAQRSAYAAIDRIDWPEGYYRRDIGWRAVGR